MRVLSTCQPLLRFLRQRGGLPGRRLFAKSCCSDSCGPEFDVSGTKSPHMICEEPCTPKIGRVTILGASSQCAQALTLLLKTCTELRQIAIHDIVDMRGIALDLSHTNTSCRVVPYSGKRSLTAALKDTAIVVIMDGWDLTLHNGTAACFTQTAPILYEYGCQIPKMCPNAMVCIASPPINSLVPLYSEAVKRNGPYNPNRIFGIPSLVETRSATLTAHYLNLFPETTFVPVIGGVSYLTSVPVFSDARPYNDFDEDAVHDLTTNILNINQACRKVHTMSPLSGAHSINCFVRRLLAALLCRQSEVSAYIRTDVVCHYSCAQYFTSRLTLNNEGVILNHGVPRLSDYEMSMLENSLKQLERDIAKGVATFNTLNVARVGKKPEPVGRPNMPKNPPSPPLPPLPTRICPTYIPPKPCCASENKCFKY